MKVNVAPPTPQVPQANDISFGMVEAVRQQQAMHAQVLKPNSNTVFLTYLHTTYVSFIPNICVSPPTQQQAMHAQVLNTDYTLLKPNSHTMLLSF
jgi:hypothetical protein